MRREGAISDAEFERLKKQALRLLTNCTQLLAAETRRNT